MPDRLSSRSWPLVGRVEELERLSRVRGAGDAPGVVLRGPAGVGKSRLAREAIAAAEREGALVEWVQATRSAATLPLGALAGLLADGLRSDDTLALLRGTAGALRERAAGRPVVVGVDDAHLLDPTSATFVQHLATTGTAFVLATVRAGEPCPDAIVALWKDGGALRVDLGALPDDEMAALIEAGLGGPVEQKALACIVESSRGNVLHARELALGALGEGVLVEHDGLWRLPGRPPPAASLAELVAARMAGLAAAERDIVELLALGEPLRLAEATAVAGDDALAAAEAGELVVVAAPLDEAEVRLAHPFYGDVVRSLLPAVRAHRLRLQLSEIVQGRDPLAQEDALRVARWRLDAGAPVPPALVLDAARAANQAGDPDLGGLLAQQALDAGAGVQATLLLARAHVVRKRFREAETVLAAAEGRIDDPPLALEYLELRCYVLQWGLERPDLLPGLLERAESWWPEAEWQRRLDLVRVHALSLTADPEAMLAVSSRTLAEPDLDATLRRQMEPVHVSNLLYSGRTREAVELARRIRPAPPLRGRSEEHAFAIWVGALWLSGLGWEELAAELPGAMAAATRGDDPSGSQRAALGLGLLAMGQGRCSEAARWFAESELHDERSDGLGARPIARSMRVGLASMSGDPDGAAEALERMSEAFAGDVPHPVLRPFIVRGQAWGALAAGDAPRAQELLLTTAKDVASPLLAAQLVYDALLAAAPARKLVSQLAALQRRCDAPRVAAYAAHAAGMALGDGDGIAAAADEFERIGALYYAMLASADAAAAFVVAGRQDSARRAAARCRDLHSRGQDVPMPVIEGLDAAGVSLTARETQLVELAARGLTNAEIADRLVLSVRTVESHVYRAMQKLGVSDRRELPHQVR